MRRGMILALAAVVLVVVVLSGVAPAYAMQAWIAKVKSDCTAVQADVVLVWDTNDENGADKFRLEVYDATTSRLVYSQNEQITQQQSPWFWQTQRLQFTVSKSHYLVELWDVNAKGDRVRRMDQVEHDCVTHASWRPAGAIQPDIIDPTPNPECFATINFYSYNVAPEDGQLMFVWSYGNRVADENYFAATQHISKGQPINPDEVWFKFPCGVYVKLFYQVDSTKAIYFLPSQYYPQDAYGTPATHGESKLWYYTYFPLNPPLRPTPTPQP